MQVLPDVERDDVVIGEAVHAAMWRAHVTQTQLARVLGIDQAAVSRRLRGRTAWSATRTPTSAGSRDDTETDPALPRPNGLRP